jgi:Protein of unknown function (DUF3300)
MQRLILRFFAAVLGLCIAASGWAQGAGPTFSKERLDQLLAPIALYPDSLLTQVLMAATYPVQVAEAVKWSAARPNDKGDAAVTQAESQGWEPSVTSLVAFPQVLATMGQKPEWVQELGDAFLAQPADTMDAVQRLRKSAQAAGTLKSNEQQKVVIENPTPQQSVIVIQPAQPQVVYVPMYNPTVVYGPWPYAAYPPYYFPPPPGYYAGNALLSGMAFGVGLAITNSLWGGWNWGRNDVDININRYNNVNVNRRISSNQNNFTHNSAARKGVPYRDAKVNEKYGRNVAGKEARDDYRGRDARDAQRDAARDTMAKRVDPKARDQLERQAGARPGAGAGPQDREAVGRDRPGSDGARDGPGREGARDRMPAGPDRAAAAQRPSKPAPERRDNALSGAGNGNVQRAQIDRGQASRQASAAAAARPRPPAARPATRAPTGASRAGGGGGGARAAGGARKGR